MDAETIYKDPRWEPVREAVLVRDNGSCLVSKLLGGRCSDGPLHVHHIVPVNEGGAPFDMDNLGSVCASHHPTWEALWPAVRRLRDKREGRKRCPHKHTSLHARLMCEARMTGGRRPSAIV